MSKAAREVLTIPGKTTAAMLDAAPAAAPATDDAPPREAPEGTAPAPVAPTPNPRQEALARLAEQAAVETGNATAVDFDERTHLERPIEEDGLPADPAVPMLVAPPDGEEPEGGAPATVADPAAVAAPATPEPKKFKVVVKGQEAEVEEQAVIEAGLHALRHHGAAELALREANALLTQARSLAGPAQEQPQGQAPASTPEDALRLAEALQFGSKEDAAKAVAAMMNRGVASADINEVVARTVETRVRDVLDQDAAAKQLEALVPELKTDRRVLALLTMEERAARAAGDTRPYTQLYPEIGQKVRGWLDSLKAPAQAPAASGTPGAPIAARQAAKASVAQPVSGRGAAPVAQAQPKPPTGSEIIAQMRAMRGQRQAI